MRSSARVCTLPDLAPSRIPGVAASSLSRFSHSLSMSAAGESPRSVNDYITGRRRRNPKAQWKMSKTSFEGYGLTRRCALLDFGSLHVHEEFVARIMICAKVPKHSACRHVRVVLHYAANH